MGSLTPFNLAPTCPLSVEQQAQVNAALAGIPAPTLAALLAQSGNAGGHDIGNVGSLTAQALAGDGSQITGIAIPDLGTVLGAGNDGGGQTISNVAVNATSVLANSIGLEGGGPLTFAAGVVAQADGNGGIGLGGANLTGVGNVAAGSLTTTGDVHITGGSSASYFFGGGFQENGLNALALDGNWIRMRSGYRLVWSASNNFSDNNDVGLARNSAGILRVTDGGSGSGLLRCSGLSTSADPYGNYAGQDRVGFVSAMGFAVGGGGASCITGGVDIQFQVYQGGPGGKVSMNPCSNGNDTKSMLEVDSQYNQTGTAGSTDLLINRNENAIGSGTHKFLDFQINGASQFSVDRAANVLATGATFSGPVNFADSTINKLGTDNGFGHSGGTTYYYVGTNGLKVNNQANTQTVLQLTNAGAVTTLHNTLDDGSGAATFSGRVNFGDNNQFTISQDLPQYNQTLFNGNNLAFISNSVDIRPSSGCYLRSYYGNEPVVLGDGYTPYGGQNVVDVAIPLILRSSLNYAVVDTRSVTGTRDNEVVQDATSGKLERWSESAGDWITITIG